jgi:hypothetical protein
MIQKVTFYGIEAELPPDCPLLYVDDHGGAHLCNSEGEEIMHCLSHTEMEYFASVAYSRWDHFFWLQTEGEGVELAEDQMDKWRKIRDAAIVGEKK